MRWLTGLTLAVATLAGSPQTALHRYEAVEPHMGTLVRITVYAEGEPEARAAFRAAFARIAELDRTLSDYRPDSELNRIAASAVGRPVAVSPDLFAVLEAAQALAEATGGAFDVTQGPVVRLWREARKTGRRPDADALREAAARSGYRKLHLDPNGRTVRFERQEMALDVGGIGKGYAASEAIETLRAAGAPRALVAVSGDIAFGDPPPGRRGWRVRVHAEPMGDDRVPPVLELRNGAVSTSGNVEQHLDIDGQRYSHVIDPESGLGLVADITVTVVARSGLQADGLDTAISVLGAERGLALVEQYPHAAALVIVRKPPHTAIRASSTFAAIARRGAP